MGFCNVEVGVLIDVCEVLEISAMVHADGLLLEDDAVQNKRQTTTRILVAFAGM